MSRTGDAVRTVLRGVGQTLITLGVVVLLFCVYELKITGLVTAHEQEQLNDELRRVWAGPAPTAPPTPKPGQPRPVAAEVEIGSGIAVLRIPRLGRWNDRPPVVVEGVGTEDLKRGPGHIPQSADIGTVGNVVLSGHRTTYGAPFNRLDELRPGDAVVVETRDSWFTYRVTGTKVVAPTAVEVTYAVPGNATAVPTQRLLTLTTCNPKYSARQRLIVSAELDEAKKKTDGRPAALTAGG